MEHYIINWMIWTLFSIIRNQKWQRKKQAWHLPRLIPVAGSGPRRQHFHSLSLSWRGAITAKLTEAKEDAVTGNVFVPKMLSHWFSNRERTERMPAQGPDVAPRGDLVPCSPVALAGILLTASASSRCGQKGTFQRSWLPNRHDWSSKISRGKAGLVLEKSWS